jgi:phosphatidylserine/phosphatidylglycerophosphate/cardiolipin synthase-like enzyme
MARVVLTKPPRPCVLEHELQQLGWRTVDIDPTERSFKRMVQGAMHRVVVMTPFFDEVGAVWLRELFTELRPGVARLLVLRSLERPQSPDYPRGYGLLKPWLAEQGVQVYNYSVQREGGPGRETFHAKVVLGDDQVAYVGSSNVNAASLEHSMEMGVELVGKAARDVAIVVQAVLASSTRYV